VPVVLTSGERKVRRIGAAGEGSYGLRLASSDNDRGDGMPGEWTGRDRRCGPGTVVRSDDGESKEKGSQARQLPLRRRVDALARRSRQADRRAFGGGQQLTDRESRRRETDARAEPAR